MAVDPRLMMVDYSQLGQIGKTIGQGIQGYRMKQTQDLAGKALMGDPSAMAELSQRDPTMAVQVGERLSQQQAQQQQAMRERDSLFATEMKEAFQTFGKADSPDQFSTAINAAISQGMFPEIARRMQDGGESIDADDFLTAKLMTGQIDDQTFDNAMKLRSETKPYIQEYTDAKGSLNTLLSVTQEDASPTDQLAAVFAFMKALDPGSVVREGEQVMVKRTDGVFGMLGNYLNQLATGEALNSGQLSNLQRTALKGFEGRAKAISDQVQYQAGLAGKFGLDKSLVAPEEVLNIDATIQSYRDQLSPIKAKDDTSPRPKNELQPVDVGDDDEIGDLLKKYGG